MRRFLAIPLLTLALMATSCHRKINTSNPAVVAASTLADASNTCKTLEDALTGANTAIEKIQAEEPDYYAQVKPLLQKVSSANRLAAHKIQAAKNDGVTGWKTAFLAIGTSIRPADLTAIQVKNPNSQIIVGSAIAGILGIIEAIGGAQ